jgi:hypothetical protein
MSLPLNPKFVRSIAVTPPTTLGANGCMLWIMKVIWEFWGFCVNGSNDLLNPGGMASSNLTGSYISMPTGFMSGTTVLLASGSDGYTLAGNPYFNVTTSSPFRYDIAGKWLVTWKSGSTSTDDSVYRISRWISSSSITIDVSTGGTPGPSSGSMPALAARSNINYRVVDCLAVANLSGFSAGNYIVMQMDDANSVNVGQRNSQFKLMCNNAGGSNNTDLSVTLSPSGSWDGTHFVGESYPDIHGETDNSGPSTGGWGAPDWFHSSGGGSGFLTMIGGKGFLICQAGGPFMPFSVGSAFHVEIPDRLYPQANDPNPICAINLGGYKFYVVSQPGYAWTSWRFPSPYDTVQRRWAVVTRSPTGSYLNSSMWPNSATDSVQNSRWPILYNKITNQVLLPDPFLSLPTINGQVSATGQFSLVRARIRSVKYMSGFSRFARFDDAAGGRWIHAGNGIVLPWDHSIVPNRDIFAGMV